MWVYVFVKRRVSLSRTENLSGMRWIYYYTSRAFVKFRSALVMSVSLRWYERAEEKRDGQSVLKITFILIQ